MKPPWVLTTKVRNTSNTKSHEHTRPSTYSTTNGPHPPTHRPNNPPTHQPTHPRCATYSNTAEYSRRCVDDDTNRVAVTLGFPCIYDYPPPRGASRSFPGRPPLAESSIGALSFAGTSLGCCVGRAWCRMAEIHGKGTQGSMLARRAAPLLLRTLLLYKTSDAREKWREGCRVSLWRD